MPINSKAIAAAALLGAVAGGAWWWTGRDDAAAQPWRTARITRGALTAAVSASGTINPVASVIVGSQVSGQIRDVLVDFNSPVKAGQVIARIDPQTFEQQVRQAQADLDAARAQVAVQQAQVVQRRADITRAEVNLADARLDLSRKEQLVERNFISSAERDKARAVARAIEQDLNAALAARDVAAAQVRNSEAAARQRQAALATAQINLGRSVIRSPVDGVVIKRSVEPGQTVAASLQSPELFVIAKNLRDMQVDTAIDESDVGRIREGQPATFTVDAFAGRMFEGAVSQVRKAAQNVQNVVTYNVVVTFLNADGHLLPGMTANVRIATDSRPDVLMVPNAALRFRLTADEGDGRGPARPSAGGGRAAAPAGQGGSVAAAGIGMPRGAQDGPGRAVGPGAGAGPDAGPGPSSGSGAGIVASASASAGAGAGAGAGSGADADLGASRMGVGGGRGRLVLLQQGKPVTVGVRTGVSDGASTEVSGPGVHEGAEVIVGRGVPAGGAGGGGRSGMPSRLF